MNEDKILRQNKIPGCERLTRPEEISALSKYLKKIKQTYDEHTELEGDKLEIPGKTTGQLVEITELSTESIKLKGKKDIELEDGIITLEDKSNIRLSEEKVGLEDKRKTELSTELIGLKDKRTTRLSDYRENISDNQDINLEGEKETISPDDISKLSDYKESFVDNRKTELEDERINIGPEDVSSLNEYIEKITDPRKVDLETKSAKLEIDEKIELEDDSTKLKVDEKIELENESAKLKTNKDISDLSDYKENISDKRKAILNDKKEGLEVDEDIELADGIIILEDKRKVELEKGYEGLEDRRKIELEKNKEGLSDPRKTELNNKKKSLFDPRKEPELSIHREDFTDDREVELADKKENISDEREVNLSEYKDSFSDIRDVNLEDERIDISPEDIDSLSDFRDNFTDDRDTNLEDEVVNINKTSDLPLSNFIDELTNGDFKEVDLENTIIKTPENSDSDAGNDHNFINPKDAVLEDGIITIVSNSDSDAGNGHNFMNPENASLSDIIASLGPDDPESNAGNNHNFLNPNNAVLEDEVVNLTPEDPESNAGNNHSFIDPNDATLEDEVVNKPGTNPESDARLIDGEYQYIIDGDIGNAAPDTVYGRILDRQKVIQRPDTSSNDATFNSGGYDYISDTDPYINNEVVDEHRKKILRPNASELDARLTELYKYKDNLTDHQLYEEVINLLESIGNDHEYDNVSSTTENFHRMTGTVGSASWVQKLEALVSAYLSGENKISPRNAHMFESALYSSFIPEARLDSKYNFIDNNTASENDYNTHKQKVEDVREKIYRPFTEKKGDARLDNSYDYIKNNLDEKKNADGTADTINDNEGDPFNVVARKKVKNHQDKLDRPVNDPESDARNTGDYNYLDKENLTSDELDEYSNQVKYGNDHFKVPVEGLGTGGGLFGLGPQSPAEKFKERDKENYEINQARVGVPDYVLSDLLVDSIQNGTYNNFNFGNTDSYLNFLKDVGNSDVSISRYLRWTAEQACKLNPGGSTTRKILLEETLAALVFARDYVERLTKSNRDRLPGDDRWYSSLINGGVGEFVQQGLNSGRNWLLGKLGIINPEKQKPLNRPKLETKDSLEGKTEKYQRTGIRSETELSFLHNYVKGLGLRTTLDDLCKSEKKNPSTLVELKDILKKGPYITTPDKFGSFNKTGKEDGFQFGSYSLDTNAYWEVILEPLCSNDLNGGISFLPSIQEINAMNKLQHGVLTGYNRWIPFISFDLQKSKMIGKSLSLFDGEINYPSSVELTNELRLTIVDDEFKSWRQYFQKCMDVSVYNSTPHKESEHFYSKPSSWLLDNLGKFTIVDKDYICIAFYKNITFNIRIYLMNPQYSTVRYYNLLCVLKDFSEEYNGDTDGGAQDLNLTFSIVGELDHNTPQADSPLDQLPIPNNESLPFNQQYDYKDTSLDHLLEGTPLSNLDLGLIGYP